MNTSKLEIYEYQTNWKYMNIRQIGKLEIYEYQANWKYMNTRQIEYI